MYTEYFGLREKPFDLLPNPDFLYPSRAHKRALTYLAHGIRERVGFILLSGEVGSGKTTLIRNLLRSQLRDAVLAKVFNTRVDSHQLLAQINSDFGLETEGRDKSTLVRDLSDFLIDQYALRRQAVLIIDEAQNLSPEILEEVRMLSNLETDRDKLLQIILVGQPELRDMLARPELLQLRQRIQINCHIQPLTVQEVGDYIVYRLDKAGNREAVTFTEEAVAAIATYTRGIPRLINILCDYVLIDAYSAQIRTIEGATVHELAADLSFEAQYWTSRPEAAGVKNDTSGNEALARSVAGQAKILAAIGSLNKRVESLEFMPSWDQSALLDLKERMANLEKGVEDRVRELRQAQQMLRAELTHKRIETVVEERVKKPGTSRRIWNFLWGG